MSGKEDFSKKYYMIQCPNCKHIFPIEDISNIVCPKCHARIVLVSVPSDNLGIEIAKAFLGLINKAVDVLFKSIELKFTQKERELEEKKNKEKLRKWKEKWGN